MAMAYLDANVSNKHQLLMGRIATFCSSSLSMVPELFASHFGDVAAMVIFWLKGEHIVGAHPNRNS